MKEDVVSIKNVTMHYDRKVAVWDVSFEVPRGSLVGIIGPNGAGKSSLVKAMLGLKEPVSGEITFFGKSDMKGKLAYVGQRNSVDWDFPITVLEVVLMGVYGTLGLMRRPSKEDKAKALAILESMGMKEFQDRQISDLSGGQQQRIFVARALLQDADVYFFDEPFVCIDMGTEKLIVELFKKLASQGKTVFVVHHDLSTVERYFDWVIMLNLRLVASGAVKTTYNLENLRKAFGETGPILEEIVELGTKKQEGLL